MKKSIIIFCFTCSFLTNYLFSQINSLEIEPLALLIGRVNINFDKVITGKNEIGIGSSFYLNYINIFQGTGLTGDPGVYSGFKISPTFTHVFYEKKMKRNSRIQPEYIGYFQVKADAGQFTASEIEYIYKGSFYQRWFQDGCIPAKFYFVRWRFLHRHQNNSNQTFLLFNKFRTSVRSSFSIAFH